MSEPESEEVESGESSPAEVETPREQRSEIQVTLGEHSKFIADNFDKLYEEVQQLKDRLEAAEIKLRTEMDEKMKAMQEMLLARIELLEARTAEQSTKIAEQQSLSKQQNAQLEDLQRQLPEVDHHTSILHDTWRAIAQRETGSE